MINNVEKFYNSRKKLLIFFRDYIEILSDTNYDAKQNETERTGLKILTPNQMLQRLPISLAQVKAGNNSEQITKKVYNYIIKSVQLWIE